MLRAVIVGPRLTSKVNIDPNVDFASRPDPEIRDIYQRQTRILNRAGITDIQVIHRDLNSDVKPSIEALFGCVPDGVLFVRYDAVLDPELLHFVTRSSAGSLILTSQRTSHLQALEPVLEMDGRLQKFKGMAWGDENAQQEFYGVALLRGVTAEKFLIELQQDRMISMSIALGRLCEDYLILVVRWTQAGLDASQKAGGGSYAKSNLVTRFRKEARQLGRRKLRDEIRFLKNLPADLQPIYPTVFDSGETDEIVYMEQEFLPLITLRQHLFTGGSTPEDATNKLHNIVEKLYQLAYAPYLQNCPDDYLEQYHFQRLWHRLNHTLERAPVFKDFLCARNIWINGKLHGNVPQLLAQLESSERALKIAKPDYVSAYIHGDLHFENIMVDPSSDDFRLVDPRGYDYCDIYYDLGKISHSTNGKYDFVHEGRFDLHWDAKDGDIEALFVVEDSPLLEVYNSMDALIRPLYREITGDPLALERTLFAEAMHFCTMMPFHLKDDGKEQKSIAIYLTGVKLLNELFEVFGIKAETSTSPIQPESWGKQEWRNVG